jgi:hypothetical protein
MINGVLAAALGGGVGGGIGALIGTGFAALGGQSSATRSRVAGIAAMVCAVAGARFAPGFFQPSFEEQADSANPVVAVMHRYYPADYQQMIETIKSTGEATGNDAAAIHAAMLPYVRRLIAAHVGNMDDQNARNTASLFVDETNLLGDKSPGTCVAMVNGKPSPVDLATLLTPELQQRDLANSAAVLEQVATHPIAPAAPLSGDALAQLSASAFSQLPSSQQDVVRRLASGGGQPETDEEMRAMCHFYTASMTAALRGPPGTVRALMATR